MSHKKYLIISDAGSMHIYNFIKCSLLGRGFDIYILSHATDPLPERNVRLYADENIHVISALDMDCRKSRTSWSQFKKFFHKWKELRKIGMIDVCHIHYLHKQSLLMYLLCRRQFKHLILTYWGTDIIKNDQKTERLQRKCFKYADIITLSVAHTLSIFKKKFVGEASSSSSKTNIIRFGGGALEDIYQLRNIVSTADCKSKMSINPDKIVLTIGYNAMPAQHQDVYIKELTTLDQDTKDKVHLIVPLQYGRSDAGYIEKVKEAIKNSGFSYTLLEEYMDYKAMATLSLATDIYLNGRETDAFSNAMKEMLFAGAFMIQGSWLKYQELDDLNWQRLFIDQPRDLPEQFKKAIEIVKNQDERKSCEFVWDTWSPSAVRKQWSEVFDNILI